MRQITTVFAAAALAVAAAACSQSAPEPENEGVAEAMPETADISETADESLVRETPAPESEAGTMQPAPTEPAPAY
ncbi:hypothetical protein N0B44_07060 [Roseibacterium beibuensis]|uniref:hypothetical protein n=1 Tax=[Roseibacterium] beibuensis TaxID=1193142 RepID=UPI00217D016F|nr:hypothetical protein [Roseibacterium beibuensis]MCS6622663.1 hypothetical protein [Roseibacterium beibuensis]